MLDAMPGERSAWTTGERSAWISGVFLVLAAVSGAVVTFLVAPSERGGSPESSKPRMIKLAEPKRSTRPERNEFKGTVSGLQAGETVWLFHAGTEDLTEIYPFNGPCPVTDGQWTCPVAYIGEPQDDREFIVWVAVLNDEQAAGAVRAISRFSPERFIKVTGDMGPPHMGKAIDSETFTRR